MLDASVLQKSFTNCQQLARMIFNRQAGKAPAAAEMKQELQHAMSCGLMITSGKLLCDTGAFRGPSTIWTRLSSFDKNT